MLEYMRKNVGSWVIKFMLFGIVVVFSFWGVGSYSDRDTNTIMTIDEMKVPYNEYREIYNILFESYREVYENLDSATLDFLDIKTQAIDALTERYLLYEAARRMNLEVSGQEIATQIASISSLQDNGMFSPQKYQLFLDLNRVTPEAYEASVARDLLLSKAMELIKVAAVITPQEVQDNLQLLTRQAVVKVLPLSPNDFLRSVTTPGEDQLLDFFEDNIELYRVPETFKQAIAVIDPSLLEDQAQVSMEEMEDWYEDREPEYTEPAAYRLKHILLSFPQDASAQDITEIRVKAEDVVQMIREGEISFENAVGKYSDDSNSLKKGGDIGFMEEDELDRPVRIAAQELELEEISDPVPTTKGFEVISVIEAREERLVPFSQVREDIEQLIQREQTFELAYDLADDLLDEVQDSARPLEELAKAKNLMTTTTPLFARSSALEAMELPQDLLQAVFDTEEEEVGDIYERDGKLYLFQTVERNDSYLPEMDEVRGQVEGGLLIKQAMEIASEKASEMLAAYEGGKSFKSLAASMQKRIITTEPFTIMETSLTEIDDAEKVIQTAFSLSEPGQAAVAGGEQSHYLIVLDSFVESSEEKLNENRSMIEGALMYQREQDILKAYVEALREEMGDRIVVNEEML
jgi:peptidyl-prolyl cis-trans isomerase D